MRGYFDFFPSTKEFVLFFFLSSCGKNQLFERSLFTIDLRGTRPRLHHPLLTLCPPFLGQLAVFGHAT